MSQPQTQPVEDFDYQGFDESALDTVLDNLEAVYGRSRAQEIASEKLKERYSQ